MANGRFMVTTRESPFGDYFRIRLTGICIVLYRGSHGWRTPAGKRAFVCHAHQIYVADLLPLTNEFNAQEIIVVRVWSGEAICLWLADRAQSAIPSGNKVLPSRVRAP